MNQLPEEGAPLPPGAEPNSSLQSTLICFPHRPRFPIKLQVYAQVGSANIATSFFFPSCYILIILEANK